MHAERSSQALTWNMDAHPSLAARKLHAEKVQFLELGDVVITNHERFKITQLVHIENFCQNVRIVRNVRMSAPDWSGLTQGWSGMLPEGWRGKHQVHTGEAQILLVASIQGTRRACAGSR